MIDLVVVNYNSLELLHDCLASIKCSCNGSKPNIVVSDNGSDEPISYIRRTYTDISIVRNKENLGYSKAINAILSSTDAPYIVLLNPDTIVVSDYFFESIVDFMNSNPDVGILGPGIVNPDGSLQGSARSFPRFHSLFFGRRSLLTKIFPKSRLTCANILTSNLDDTNPVKADWVSGACMVIRREALEHVGKMDDRFFMYWEDVDWCKRMWDNGWKVMYWPEIKIMHHVGGSSDSRIIRSVFEFHKSAILYFEKHINHNRWILLPPIFTAIYARFLFILSLHLIKKCLKFSTNKPLVTNEEAAISWLYQTCVKEKKYEEKTDMPYHFINKSYVISDAERLNNFASD
jgi:GT2 family glycosyltransferase